MSDSSKEPTIIKGVKVEVFDLAIETLALAGELLAALPKGHKKYPGFSKRAKSLYKKVKKELE